MVPVPNLGLNFDPSHLIWQGIDYEQALRAVADRVFLAHAKDTEIFAERLQQVGYFGRGWWTYRLPGHGRIDWRRWLALLDEVGFDGVVSIEHEDRDWGSPAGPPAQRYGVPRVYQQPEDMLAQEQLDGLVASQPFERHGQVIPPLYAARIPVFTEKPLAASVEVGEALVAALRAGGSWHMVGYHKRSDPATIYARQ